MGQFSHQPLPETRCQVASQKLEQTRAKAQTIQSQYGSIPMIAGALPSLRENLIKLGAVLDEAHAFCMKCGEGSPCEKYGRDCPIGFAMLTLSTIDFSLGALTAQAATYRLRGAETVATH